MRKKSEKQTNPLKLFLSRKDRVHLEQSDPSFMRTDSLDIVTLPVARMNDELTQLENLGLLKPGQLVLRSPHGTQRYASMDDAEHQFAIEKYELFIEFCQILGAKYVEIKDVQAHEHLSEKEVSANAKIGPGVGGKAKAETEYENKIKGSIQLITTFKGSIANVGDAAIFIARHNLEGEHGFGHLLRIRKNETNAIKEESVSIDLTKQLRNSLAIAVSLKAPVSHIPVSIDLGFKEKIREKIHCNLKIKVKF